MTATRYHHGNLREALVEAAVESARDRRPRGLSLRELARRVGVSHDAAYRHFADRDALVDVVAERALAASLVAEVRRRLEAVDESRRSDARPAPARGDRGRLRRLRGHRAAVSSACSSPPIPRARTARATAGGDGDDPYGMLNQALDELVAVGYLAAPTAPGAEITCWAAVHGFSVLNVEGPLRGLTAADRDAALSTLLLGIDRAFGAGGSWPELAPVRLARA